MEEEKKEKKKVGFALMTPEQRREIAKKGGRNVPAHKRSFKNKALASQAGILGGKNVAPSKRSFSKDRALARRAGKIGGEGRAKKKDDKDGQVAQTTVA